MQHDTSFEVRWSLSELEDIVFEFINAHDLPAEFKIASPLSDEEKQATIKRSLANTNNKGAKATNVKMKSARRDVDRDDLMNV